MDNQNSQQTFASLICQFYKEARFAIVGKEEQPETLFHYTSMDAVEKIIAGNALRFTHAHFMNDAQELQYGIEILHEHLIQKSEAHPESRIKNLLNILAIALCIVPADAKTRERHINGLKTNRWLENNPGQWAIIEKWHSLDFFFASFSQQNDSLPMWYMYADHAKGAALGFNFDQLISEHNAILRRIGDYTLFAKVIYDEGIFKKLINDFTNKLIEFVVQKSEEDFKALQNGSEGNDFFSAVLHYLFLLASTFKHHAYSHEEEWRLIAVAKRHDSQNPRTFITKNGLVKPGIHIAYPTPLAQKICKISVALGNPNDKEWVSIFMKSKNVDCSVDVSVIPFRDI